MAGSAPDRLHQQESPPSPRRTHRENDGAPRPVPFPPTARLADGWPKTLLDPVSTRSAMLLQNIVNTVVVGQKQSLGRHKSTAATPEPNHCFQQATGFWIPQLPRRDMEPQGSKRFGIELEQLIRRPFASQRYDWLRCLHDEPSLRRHRGQRTQTRVQRASTYCNQALP